MANDGNENIYHVNCAEGSLSEAWKHLNSIDPKYPREKLAKAQAIEEIDLFIKTTLTDLRTLCEGD